MAEDAPASNRPKVEVLVEEKPMNGVIVSIEVEDNDRLIDKATIVVQDAERVCTDFASEGQKVRITLGWQSQHAVVFEGHITRVAGPDNGTYPRRVTMTALDPSYFMNITRRPVTPHKGKLSEIIAAVVSLPEYKKHFAIGKIDLDKEVEFPPDKPLMQGNETDLQFLYRLAMLYSARAFVEMNGEKLQFYFISEKKLMANDALGTLNYCQGFSELIDFSFQRVASDAQPVRSGVAVNPEDGSAIATPPPTAPQPSSPPPSDAGHIAHVDKRGGNTAAYRAGADVANRAAVKPEQYRHHNFMSGLPSNPNLVEEITRQDPTRILGLRGEGTAVGNVMIRAKGKIGINGLAAWVDGNWYVHKVVHTVNLSGKEQSFRTKFSVSR